MWTNNFCKHDTRPPIRLIHIVYFLQVIVSSNAPVYSVYLNSVFVFGNTGYLPVYWKRNCDYAMYIFPVNFSLFFISFYTFQRAISGKLRTRKGGLMQKKNYREIFWAPPSDRKKKSGPPFLPWKLRVNPIEKHVNSIFDGKYVVIFSGPPFQESKMLRAPFLHQGPLTSVCKRSLVVISPVIMYGKSQRSQVSFFP